MVLLEPKSFHLLSAFIRIYPHLHPHTRIYLHNLGANWSVFVREGPCSSSESPTIPHPKHLLPARHPVPFFNLQPRVLHDFFIRVSLCSFAVKILSGYGRPLCSLRSLLFNFSFLTLFASSLFIPSPAYLTTAKKVVKRSRRLRRLRRRYFL